MTRFAGLSLVLAYDPAAGVLTLDRTDAGETAFHPAFASVESAPVLLEDGVLTLRIVVDHCSVEVFAQGGKVVLTDLIFPLTWGVSLCRPHPATPRGNF